MEEAIFNEDKLWRQIEEVISRIISQYMEMESVNLMPVNMADLKRKLFANFVSIILLSNEDITIYVRTYYNYRDLKQDRKSTRLNSSHSQQSRMPSSA